MGGKVTNDSNFHFVGKKNIQSHQARRLTWQLQKIFLYISYIWGFTCVSLCVPCACVPEQSSRCLWAAVWMPEFSARTASAHPLNQLSSPLASILTNGDRFLRSNPTRKRRLKLSEWWAAWKWPEQVWADRWRVTAIIARSGHQSQGPIIFFLSF